MVGLETRDPRRDGGEGGGRMVQSDPGVRQPGLQVTQQSVREKAPSHAGHRYAARQTLLRLCGTRRVRSETLARQRS